MINEENVLAKKACYLLVDIARFVQVRPEHSSNKGHLKPKNEKEDWYKANIKKQKMADLRLFHDFHFTYLSSKVINERTMKYYWIERNETLIFFFFLSYDWNIKDIIIDLLHIIWKACQKDFLPIFLISTIFTCNLL